MTAEEHIYDTLKHLAGGRVFPDFAPEGEDLPLIVYQAVGGEPANFVSGDQPDKQHTRMQVSVWAATRLQASELGDQVERAVRAATALQTEVAAGRVAVYDEETKYRGTRQDFYLFC
ncbi:DUF3168 domain-containing protein [uncultured Massilia sp.]|uniref:DUF3168 domain-containing protein n=1 Tax=uncultured Massilia sp. TaxID=169973 RepID=UPI002584965E|nr:DUF3168 domain-containing protein [uncultured Massilia sp.]